MVGKQDARSSLVRLLKSPPYRTLAKNSLAGTGFHLCGDLYDAEIDESLNFLKHSKISLEEITTLIEREPDLLEAASRKIIAADRELDLGQEYNAAEPPEDETLEEQYLGHSPTYLFEYAVLFLLARRGTGDLVSYFKKMKMPRPADRAAIIARLLPANT